MFTRCPSCKSEISFEPPENFEFLPNGYRHRLQCPNCGIAIGVSIPKPPPKVIEEINIDKYSSITTECENSMIKDVQLFCVKIDSINMLNDNSLTLFH